MRWGMAFQITDDIMDYRETSDTTGKPVGNDLREGLLTYPLLSIVNESNQNQLLQDIKNLNHGGNEQEIIDYVIAQGGIDNTYGSHNNIVMMRYLHYNLYVILMAKSF